jgi:hypothetical protein
MNYLAFKIYLVKYLSVSSNGNTSVLDNCLIWFNMIIYIHLRFIDCFIYIYIYIIYLYINNI